MNLYGTPIEITQRQISETEQKILLQVALIAQLEKWGYGTRKDKGILESFYVLLCFLQEDLKNLKAKAAQLYPDLRHKKETAIALEERQTTLLEEVQQYIYRAEEQFVHQTAFVAELERQGLDRTEAEKTLECFKGTLHSMRESFTILQRLTSKVAGSL